MNRAILRKVIEELKKDEPKLDYIRGMLDTLYEMQDDEPIEKPPTIAITAPTFKETQDEADILDAQARAALEVVKGLSESSQEA